MFVVRWCSLFASTNLIGCRIHYPIDGSLPGGNDHCYQLNHVGQTWNDAMATCDDAMLTIQSMDEFNFLKTQILEPQSEISGIWLAGRKLMQGLLSLLITLSRKN